MFDDIRQDLRYAVRVLVKDRAFTLIALLILSVGISGAVAMFSVARATLFRQLPYPNAPRVVAVWSSSAEQKLDRFPTSGPDYLDWRAKNGTFDAMAAFTVRDANLGAVSQPERIRIAAVAPSFFEVLGVRPLFGRVFVEGEDAESAPRVVVLSERLWRSRLGSSPDAVGHTLRLDGEPFTVVGVMRADVELPESADLWQPLVLGFAARPDMRASHGLSIIARLRPGVAIEQARSAMRSLAAQLAQTYPESNTGWSVALVPLREQLVGDTRSALLAAIGAVLALLAIGCANVANLLFTRAAGRRRDIMVRVALGAARGRIVRYALAESLVLSVAAGVLGVLLAVWGTGMVARVAPQVAALAAARDVSVDPIALVFALGVALLTGISFGIAPAISASRLDVNSTLREGGRGTTDSGRVRSIRSALTVAQIALSLVLLVGAGLLVESLIRLQHEGVGFQTAGRVAMDVSFAGPAYATDARRAAATARLLEQVRAVPGVGSAALVRQLPMGPDQVEHNSFDIEGHAATRTGQEMPGAFQRPVTPEYFATMGIPLYRGRVFRDGDDRNASLVGLVDSAAVRRYWPNEDPVGKRITYGRPEGPRVVTIVGVVGSVKHERMSTELQPAVYVPAAQWPSGDMTIVVRTSAAPSAVAAALGRAARTVDPELPVSNLRTLDEVASDAIWRPRFASLLVGSIAAIAFLLAALGIYGIMSYNVAQRSTELALRMALGARPVVVARMVLERSLGLAGLGIAIGLGMALGAAGLVSRLLYGVSPFEPGVYLLVVGSLGTMSLLAAAVPAVRAMRVSPGEVLRGQ